MKKIFFAVFFCLFAQLTFAQTEKSLTADEQARVKFSVHLIDYSTPPVFEKASGQAYYNLVKFSFSENLHIPVINDAGISANDLTVINGYISLLQGAKQNPLSWEHLFALETQYQNWLDKSQHKVSIYQK